ncbi:MAG: hypothetical protein AB9856_21590 [Cellulosilyticaceae bacterium]
MTLKYCCSCGEKLTRITTKTSVYKAVCLNCEITYKVVKNEQNQEVITHKGSTPPQITEASMNYKA